MIQSLYLSYDGLTDPLGQSQILPYLLRLEAKGIAFHIISFEKLENFRRNKNSIYALIRDKSIYWYPLPYHKNPPVLSAIYDLYRLKQSAARIAKEKDIRIVHCRSYITSLTGLWLKRKYNLKFIFDMRGFWADERIEGSIWNLKNPLFRIIYHYFKNKEKQFFESADAIISLTENARSHIIKQFSPHNPVTIIPCCADAGLFSKKNLSSKALGEIKNLLDEGKTFKLLYLGSLGTWYEFEAMLDFFNTMAAATSKSQFVVLTNDVAVAREKLHSRHWVLSDSDRQIFGKSLQRYSNSKFAGQKIVVTQASRSHVPAFIEYADATILFIKPSFSKKASSATKMGEALLMGKPVITNAGWGDIERFRSEINNLYVVDSFNGSEYQKVIQKLTEKAPLKMEAPSPFALDYFSLQKGVEKYYKVYQSLNDRE